MDAFSAAMDAQFASPMAADALWLDQGFNPGIPCRVILSKPDEITEFGVTRIRSETTVIEVRTAEVNKLRPGDLFQIGSDRFKVQGAPYRDVLRLVWTVDTVPA